MKVGALREKTVAELNAELMGLLQEQFSLRMQLHTKQLKAVHRIGLVRKNIARVKTIIGEKQRAGEQS